MLIRKEQLDTLQNAVLCSYRNDLMDHFRVFAPELFKAAGEDQFRIFIEYGTGKAINMGLTLRGPMRLFLDLMCILGQDFDIDPQYRPLWPAGNPKQIPMPFAQRLHTNFAEYLNRCVGADKRILANALRKILSMPFDPVGTPFRSWTRERLSGIYPQKLEYMGEDNLSALLDACDETAGKARIETPRGHLLVVVLAVSFGVNFLSNPLYPWVSKRLLAESPEEVRVEKTLSALHIYASQMLKGLEKGA